MGAVNLFYFLLFLLFFVVFAWHGYKEQEEEQNNSIDKGKPKHCHSYAEATKPPSKEEYDKMKLWSAMRNFNNSNEKSESLYGFKHSIEAIWKHQFPEDCSNKKFLISGGWPYGFGSRIHMEGIGLAIAMQMGRIYLHHPDGDNIFWETNNPFCKGVRKDRTLMCFYERWSSCTFQDALSEANNDVNRLKTVGFPDFNAVFNSDENIRNNFIQQYSNDRAINILFTFNGKGQFVLSSAIPHSFNHVLECSPMRIDNKYYWWRAISSAFLLRPNEDTLTLLKKYHNLALTPSDNCVSLFVRHADKVMEMELLPFQTYAETAKMIIEKELSPKPEMSNEIFGFNGSLFLSTDDPDVIHQAEEWSKQNNWKVVYTHLFDRGTQTARLDWNSQHKKGTVAVHDDLEYFSMLLNLEYSVQCEAWVCTLASNSCRVIDEMRATVAAKAGNMYADLSKETCKAPPCLGSGIYSFGE